MKNEKMAAFEESMRDAVNILKGPDDPHIEEITAYMREYVRRSEKAKRGEVADEEVWFASKVAPSIPRRRTYRRY